MVRDQLKDESIFAKAAEARSQTTKEEFGRRVYRLMLSKNMNQSDLARAAGLERNRISAYVRGAALPTGLYLKKLAEALHVKPEELMPETLMADAPAPYSMTVSPDGKNMRITADAWVPTPIGAQIIQLFTDATAHRD